MGEIIQYVGTIYGQDISNELQYKKIVLKKPEHSADIKTQHALRVAVIKQSQTNLVSARTEQKKLLVQNISVTGIINLAKLDNEILITDFENQQKVSIIMTEDEKTKHSNT